MKPVQHRLCHTALAAQALLVGMAAAHAEDDPKLYALTHAGNTVELGLAAASRFSAKAEEYTGVTRRGPNLVLGLDLHGGAAFDSTDADALRWSLRGSDLGLRSRDIEGEVGVQGRWRLRLGYDELQRNQSDSYQSPYQGVGTNTLTLPAGWRVPLVPRVSATAPNARGLSPEVTSSGAIVGGVVTAPTAAQAATAAALQAADLPGFRTVDLFTRRSRSQIGGSVDLPGGWSLNAQLAHEHREGLKPQGAQSRATNGDTSSILPLPIDEDDRRIELGLGYVGETLQLQAGLEGSSFGNHVPSVTWDLWAAPTLHATMATAPSNRFVKLSLAAQWQPAPGTRLQASASRGRATQDERLLSDATALVVPVESPQARVVTESAGLKLLQQAGKDWRLSAHLKHDLRANHTPVAQFGFYDNDNAATGTSPFARLFPGLTGLGQNFNINANTPYSRRTDSTGADAELRIAPDERLKFGADASRTRRWCEGSWINCADATKAHETTLHADWSAAYSPELSTRLGLSTARRHVTYDENAFLAVVPMAGVSPSTATGALAGSTALGTLQALGLTGYGPVSGLQPAAAAGSAQAFYFPNNNALDNLLYGNENRISELVGMRRFNQADRQRHVLRSSATWSPAEAWTLQAGFDATSDRYPRSTYGLQRLGSRALNVDASWAPAADTRVSVFASHERQRSRTAGNTYTANSTATAVGGATAIDGGCFATIALRNASNKVDPCLDWTSAQRDVNTLLGAAFTQGDLAGGRLALDGSAAVGRGRTDIAVTGGNYANNPFAGVAANPTGTTAAYYVPASALPTVSVDTVDLRLGARWRLGADSAVRLGWQYRHLRGTDWATEGLQDGSLTQVLPTREQAPRHGVHSLGVAYAVSF